MDSTLAGLLKSWADIERKKSGIPTSQEYAQSQQDRALALQHAGLTNEQLQAAIEHLKAQTSTLPQMTGMNVKNLQSEIDLRTAQAEAARAKGSDQGKMVPLLGNSGEVLGFYFDKQSTNPNSPVKINTNVPPGMRVKPPPAPKAPAVSPIQIVTPEGNPAVWNVPKTPGVTEFPTGSARASDVAAERKAAVTATAPINTVETLANQVDNALTKYEQSSWAHPVDKVVAQSSYSNLLNALAVPWGRLLGDTRISDQDRTSYSRSVGEPSIFMKEMAPQLARERLANLWVVLQDIRQKYGPVLEGTQGLLAPIGGGARLSGGEHKTTGLEDLFKKHSIQ